MVYETIILIGNAIILLGTLTIGSVVLYQGIRRRMSNLGILGMLYLLTSLSKIIQVSLDVQWAQIAYFQTAIPILILEFTRRTFYWNRDDTKMMTITFYILTIASYLVSAFFAFQYTGTGFQNRSLYNIGATFDILTVILPNIYTIIASLQAINHFDPTQVEGYIIARTRLWMYISFIFAFAYGLWFMELLIPGDFTYAVLNSISTIVGLIYMIGSYLTWVLPSWFKEYLNRNTQVEELDDKESKEEDIELDETERTEIKKADVLKFLGSQLSNYINTSELAARGHLRYAVRNIFPDRSIRELNYANWEKVLNEPLINQMGKLAIPIEAEQVSSKMLENLKRSQAIITMAAS